MLYEDGSIEGETVEMESEVTPEGEVAQSPDSQSTETPVEESVDNDKEDETGYWEEYFGGKTDSKPYGPQSVGADITFIMSLVSMVFLNIALHSNFKRLLEDLIQILIVSLILMSLNLLQTSHLLYMEVSLS